jgi:serine protease Do
MKRPTTPIVCALMLLIGSAAGAFIATSGGFSPRLARAEPTSGEPLPASQSGLAVLQRGSQELARIARNVTRSVVHIQSTRRTSDRVVEETGSGVVVASRFASGTFVVTNCHVIDSAKMSDIDVRTQDGRTLHPERAWKDPESDVAVLKLPANDLVPAEWGDSDSVEMGHFVLAVGSPFGLSQSITMGIISAKGRRSLKLGSRKHQMLNQDFLQTDAAINPGNSGGPLIDLNGRIVGINTAIASNSGGNDGIGFSIPSNMVRNVMEQLVSKGHVSRAYLGVKLDSDFTENTARRLGLSRPRGARILEIYSRTPAAEAGLKFDDVVIQFNGIRVQDENHLINLVSLTPIGTTAKLRVVRKGKEEIVPVRLADRDELIRRSATERKQ